MPIPTPPVYYVSATGDFANAGTIDAPWSIGRAADSAPPGSTIYLRGGTYPAFVIRASGTVTAPIRFTAYPGEQPIVDGVGTAQYTVWFDRVAYVELDGLTIQGGYGPAQSGGGVLVQSANHVVLRGNSVRDNRAFGVRVLNSTDVLVDDNDIYGNAIGIQVNLLGEGVTVRGNRIHDNNLMAVNTADKPGDDAGGEAMAIVRTTGRVLVERNQLWGNRAVSYDYGYDGGAFSVYAASNWTIRDNVTWDNRNIFESGTDAARTPCDGGLFVRNVNYAATTVDRTVGMVLRCASNTLVANNTFVGMQYFVFDISHMTGTFGGSIEGLRVLNNVTAITTGKIYGLESALPPSVVIDYNVVSKTGSGQWATIQGSSVMSLAAFATATGREVHGLGASPLFVSTAANDFRLDVGSPAIDLGLVLPGITDFFEGAGPDRGYAESGGT